MVRRGEKVYFPREAMDALQLAIAAGWMPVEKLPSKVRGRPADPLVGRRNERIIALKEEHPKWPYAKIAREVNEELNLFEKHACNEDVARQVVYQHRKAVKELEAQDPSQEKNDHSQRDE